MKKNILLVSGIVFFVFLFLVVTSGSINSRVAGDFKYVGVSKCMTCHKSEAQGKQYDIWKSSKHSSAWTSLTTDAADKIAKDKGFSTKASETPQCIKCHVLGKDINPDELADSFNKEDGVQCETCHGPGSEYKSLSIMKDKQKAMDNGPIIHNEKEKFCITCHNADSPTYKEFNYDTYWDQIKHMIPPK
jgi:excinuclease UvrABC ATPase subunit